MGAWVHRISEVNEESMTATCTNCGPVFVQRRSSGSWACRIAQGKWKKEADASWRLRPGEREVLLEKQEGVCGVCRTRLPRVVDHDHQTGAVRGLLCVPCNAALGWVEQPGWLEAAQRYLG